MIAAEGLVAVCRMIVAYRRSGGAATNYEIALVTVVPQHLRAGDDVWARMIPCTDGRGLYGSVSGTWDVAAPASLLALASWEHGHGSAHARPTRGGKRQHGFCGVAAKGCGHAGHYPSAS